MKRVLITGINGFVGSHLAEFVIRNELAVVSGTMRSFSESTANIVAVKDKIELLECDLSEAEKLSGIVKDSRPNIVFHLAAQPFVPASFKAPEETLKTNILGSLNVFEAVKASAPDSTLVVASTGEVYGFVKPEELPIRETNQLRPLNPYAVSKAAMEMLGWQYFKNFGLKVIAARFFNMAGPRQGDAFVVSNWAKQVAEVEAGKKEAFIDVGNLNVERDFTDVRDSVRAAWLLGVKGTAGETFNVCSSKAVKLSKLMEIFEKKANAKFSVRVDNAKMRPNDSRSVQGNSSKLKSVTEWKPEIPLEKTIEDTLDYWRAKVRE